MVNYKVNIEIEDPSLITCRRIRWEGIVLAEVLGGVADEAEGVVGGEAFVGEKGRGADGGIVGAFEDGGGVTVQGILNQPPAVAGD